jgi:hypothetical protein
MHNFPIEGTLLVLSGVTHKELGACCVQYPHDYQQNSKKKRYNQQPYEQPWANYYLSLPRNFVALSTALITLACCHFCSVSHIHPRFSSFDYRRRTTVSLSCHDTRIFLSSSVRQTDRQTLWRKELLPAIRGNRVCNTTVGTHPPVCSWSYDHGFTILWSTAEFNTGVI